MTGDKTEGVNFKKLFASIDTMDTESFLRFIRTDANWELQIRPLRE